MKKTPPASKSKTLLSATLSIKRPQALLVILLFVTVGVAAIYYSHAATITNSAEAEKGTLATQASVISDGNASGGQAVRFGAATGATPTPTTAPTPTPAPTSTPVAASNISCNYQTDTWSGDASSVGYGVTKVSSKDGNPASLSVKLSAHSGTTEVVGYPSVQCLTYAALPSNLTSSFNITPPASSNGLDYEFAYDIWLTTASSATSNNWNNDLELMIWNYNNGQTPAGSVKSTLADGSKVWVAGNNSTGTVSVVLPKNETSGTVNISSMVSQLKSLGYVNSSYNGYLDLEYGVEAPYGGGQTFTVNSLSVAY